MTTTDGDLAAYGAVADTQINLGPDGVSVGCRLGECEGEPVSKSGGRVGRSRPDVATDFDGDSPIDDHQVEEAIEVEIDECCAA
jgi:hypothetical protein